MLPGPGDEGYCRVWAALLLDLAFLAVPGGGERPAVIGPLLSFGRLLLCAAGDRAAAGGAVSVRLSPSAAVCRGY
jgi:hypothetical protein